MTSTHRYKSTVCEDKSRCYHAVLSLVRVSPRIVFPPLFPPLARVSPILFRGEITISRKLNRVLNERTNERTILGEKKKKKKRKKKIYPKE